MDVQYSLFGNDSEREEGRAVSRDKDALMSAIETEIAKCTACRLHSTRTNTVPGEGSLDAKLMFIGEGPGADEDAKGRPFVGAAGKLLDNIIGAMGLRREQVYIANIVKCRPPQNRVPEKDEMDACIHYLRRQIGVISPEIIVLLGATSLKTFFPGIKDGISRMRGSLLDIEGRKFVPTFHPAALLRDPSKKIDVWNDMKKVMTLLKKES